VDVALHVVIRAILVAEPASKESMPAVKRTQKHRKRSRWTKPLRFRDREAPGSNPGPPTKIRIQSRSAGGIKAIGGLDHCSSSVAVSRTIYLADAQGCATDLNAGGRMP
jgi:hypothetical protein